MSLITGHRVDLYPTLPLEVFERVWDAMMVDPMRHLFWHDGMPITLESTYAYFFADPGHRMTVAASVDGSLAALCSFDDLVRDAQGHLLRGTLWYYGMPRHRYRGLSVRKTLMQLTRMIGPQYIDTYIHPLHDRSRRIALSLGFTFLCTRKSLLIFDGVPWDMHLYGLERTDG